MTIRRFYALLVLILQVVIFTSASSASFTNLDFEQGYTDDHEVPGWGRVNQQGTLCFDPGCPYLGGPYDKDVLGWTSLAGEYSLSLNGSDGGFATAGSGSISQTGTVPADSQSIRILVSEWGYRVTDFTKDPELRNAGTASAADLLKITLDGQEIQMQEVERFADGAATIAGDISAFAGRNLKLRLTANTSRVAPPGVDPWIRVESDHELIEYGWTRGYDAAVWGSFDNVEFSPYAVPEPSAVFLFFIALAVWNEWRRRNFNGRRN